MTPQSLRSLVLAASPSATKSKNIKRRGAERTAKARVKNHGKQKAAIAVLQRHKDEIIAKLPAERAFVDALGVNLQPIDFLRSYTNYVRDCDRRPRVPESDWDDLRDDHYAAGLFWLILNVRELGVHHPSSYLHICKERRGLPSLCVVPAREVFGLLHPRSLDKLRVAPKDFGRARLTGPSQTRTKRTARASCEWNLSVQLKVGALRIVLSVST